MHGYHTTYGHYIRLYYTMVIMPTMVETFIFGSGSGFEILVGFTFESDSFELNLDWGLGYGFLISVFHLVVFNSCNQFLSLAAFDRLIYLVERQTMS